MNNNVTLTRTRINYPSENHGNLAVWLEARVPSKVDGGFTEGEVWAARAGDSLGYGETPAEAVISALEGVEMAPEWHLQVRAGESPVIPESERKELPGGFWASLSHDMRYSAIKVLRAETGMSTKSARQIVEKMMEPKAPVFPGVVGRWTVAEEAPSGTVIRIKGEMDDGNYAGYVFEKIGADDHVLPPWITTESEAHYPDSEVQGAIDKNGYDLLYVPRARA